MRTAEELILDWAETPHCLTIELVRAAQVDALEAAAECAEQYAMTGVPVADEIRALKPKETP